MILKRLSFLKTGIFGELTEDEGTHTAWTLEFPVQSVGDSPGSFVYSPKVPPGTYLCQKGMHKLIGMTDYFSTFQILNVPNHTGILFHPGNTARDTDGCVLLGESYDVNQLYNSREAFEAFMELVGGEDSFTLIVR